MYDTSLSTEPHPQLVKVYYGKMPIASRPTIAYDDTFSTIFVKRSNYSFVSAASHNYGSRITGTKLTFAGVPAKIELAQTVTV